MRESTATWDLKKIIEKRKAKSLSQTVSSRQWMNHFARNTVFRQLKKMHSGHLSIVEGNDKTLFGNPNASTSLSATLTIVNPNAYVDIMTSGSIGAAEAYMAGYWTTPDLTEVIQVMVRNRDIVDQLDGGLTLLTKPILKGIHWLNRNTQTGSKRNIVAHYDLGNEFFKLFLDKKMMYSSAIFPNENASLEEAAIYKLDHICRKLQLKPSDHVVEIGTGWGGFAIHAATYYGCKVTTTTISEQQYAFAKEQIANEGLEDKITLLKQDYRELRGEFDKLVSIEMIEAVGWQFYNTFFEQCSRLLKPNGVMLLQAITIEDQRYDSARRNVDFIQRYVFPGSCIPSLHALNTASKESSDLRPIHQEDFAEHYARTLKVWHERFQTQRDAVLDQGYSEEFIRMWKFYLSYCEGGFSERAIGVSHIMYAKPLYREERVINVDYTQKDDSTLQLKGVECEK